MGRIEWSVEGKTSQAAIFTGLGLNASPALPMRMEDSGPRGPRKWDPEPLSTTDVTAVLINRKT